jgi:hypothetical protein
MKKKLDLDHYSKVPSCEMIHSADLESSSSSYNP